LIGAESYDAESSNGETDPGETTARHSNHR
jgi:hypothetical protein